MPFTLPPSVAAGFAWRIVLGLLFAPWMAATANAEPIDFGREVFAVLQRSCFECHNHERQEAGLRLDTRAELLASGSVVPGEPNESELFRRIALPAGHDEIMPAIGNPLRPAEVAAIERWIRQGAAWPKDFAPPQHWAYLAPVRPEAAHVSDTEWVRSPIDALVLRRLEEEGLRPSPPADPAKLVRRLYLDLIGLPPRPEEVNAFVADPTEERLEQLVDDLLARPQFGERWARPWLDLARYADSHGFQRDDLRDIWPYRDWVIRALNDDMPFDQFTLEQIAGDLLPDATEDQKIATGFHRCTPTNVEAGSLPEETRVEQVIDRVNTTAAVWLGTTLECCQCHDHKYDPFPMTDYYRMLAFFNNTQQEADRADPNNASSIRFEGPALTLANPERTRQRQHLQQQKAEVQTELEARKTALKDSLAAWVKGEGAEKLSTAAKPVQRIAEKPADQWNDQQRESLLQFRLKHDPAGARLLKQQTQLDKRLKEVAPETTLVMVEQEEPRETRIFLRGDYQSPGDLVQPGTPQILHPLPEGPANRLTLARWLVARENPLVARVVVNRWWAELFGQGIVPTEEDFGLKGEAPSHPELLDWLAVEFMDGGWSQKRILKTIVLSATYRQSSRITPELQAKDPDNRLLARGPRFRMDAEMIRDNALAISGLLSLEPFGPPIRPYQPDGIWNKVGGMKYDYQVSPGDSQYRRGIYVVWKRGSPYPSFINFDATPRLACTVQRSRTNTPLQALTLLNDRVYVEAAQALAERILAEKAGESRAAQVDYAFQCCTGRVPTPRERARIEALLEAQWTEADADQAQLDAWRSVATALLNLHETITKD